ncbi:MAG: M23 family metallopeptidase [Clostridia bacterium]|nr:M23 family metallopeptidase [Clostridia bacterium]
MALNDVTCRFGEGDHKGFYIGAPEGTKIVAAADGYVESAEYHYSWGNNVYIKHDDTYYTRYAHMVRVGGSAGQQVKRGEVIGFVGDTGESFGNHLHFEVYKNGERIDPYPFIK